MTPSRSPRLWPASWSRATPSEDLVEAVRRRFALGPIRRFEHVGGVMNLNLLP